MASFQDALSESEKTLNLEESPSVSDNSAIKSYLSGVSMIENSPSDTYAEDIIMQKIIYYISLFSSEVKQSLQNMRSKDMLT